jgi:cysteine-rich repeat protein
LNTGEECDDGNGSDLDGCSSYCLFEAGRCGDRVIQSLLGEQCEPGGASPLQCTTTCRYLLLHCGDGRLDAGENCDEGAANANAAGSRCRPDCSLGRCGDAVGDPGEQCDDGNRLSGDGCSAFCFRERPAATLTQQPAALPASVVDLPFTPMNQQPGTSNNTAASLTNPSLQGLPGTTDSGPEALAIMASGAAAGLAWMRRRRMR